ncbi:MAG TPA: hypothetical protein VFV49_09730, partial [Thermoanaerobaculia bacterium]|nr:hypothetical protein [Thermoanaerobaculia bacterium]
MDTNVIIFFVGLTMFSSQIPNDSGMKAILPRVVYVDPTQPSHQVHVARAEPIRFEQASPGQTGRLAPALAPSATLAQDATGSRFRAGEVVTPIGPQRHVEDHESVIIFPSSVYHPSSSWPKTTLQTDPNYSYVMLRGDFVRFLTQPPAGSPPFTKAGLILPPLTSLCPGMNQLQSSYLPPYQGAAAVFDLADEGELSSCSSVTKASPPAFRFDSKLKLRATGPWFVVSASTMTTTKELRLDLRNVNGDL